MLDAHSRHAEIRDRLYELGAKAKLACEPGILEQTFSSGVLAMRGVHRRDACATGGLHKRDACATRSSAGVERLEPKPLALAVQGDRVNTEYLRRLVPPLHALDDAANVLVLKCLQREVASQLDV